jgi:hypothetical protein
MTSLEPEDAKLVTLAKASRARNGSAEGAAVRDLDGRTYAASSVSLQSLQLTALETAVAMAVSSAAAGLEAAAVVTAVDLPAVHIEVARDLGGTGVNVYVASWDGEVAGVLHT